MKRAGRQAGRRRALAALAAALLAAALGGPAAAGDWVLALADTVRVAGATVRLADVATEPVPPDLADMVLIGGGQPGTAQALERRVVLRRLVELGRAGEVRRCAGAEVCRVLFCGEAMPVRDLESRVAALLAPWVPAPPDSAPPPWLEVQLKSPLTFGGAASVELVDPQPLRPGRNLVAVRVSNPERAARLTASVVCHAYGETARARAALPAESRLSPDQFLWSWSDLAGGAAGLAVGRESLAGRSAARALTPGEPLRASDLRVTPLVRAGEVVQLDVARGAVLVTVNGLARQDGALDQVITVRNEVNGKLVTARVVGPGRVQMGR